MGRRLKERLIGAAVLVMIAVIFIPMILDDSSETDVTITETNILTRPDDDFNSRIVPLQESDLTPVPDASSPQTEPEPQAEIQDIPENFAIQKSTDIEVEKKSSVIDLSTETKYSFSWLFPARKILFTISPSLVKKIKPSEGLSKRPIGNNLSG